MESDRVRYENTECERQRCVWQESRMYPDMDVEHENNNPEHSEHAKKDLEHANNDLEHLEHGNYDPEHPEHGNNNLDHPEHGNNDTSRKWKQ